MPTRSSRRLLEGVKEIAAHLRIEEGVNNRRRVLTWVRRAGLPAKLVGGRWYAYSDELDGWWAVLGGSNGG